MIPKKITAALPFVLLTILCLLLVAFLLGARDLEQLFISRIGREIELSTKISTVAIRDFLQKNKEENIPDFVERELTPLLDNQTRITILRGDGEVLADSWENRSVMGNHATREEFILFKEKFETEQLTDKADSNLPCTTFQRYSTTTHQNMLYCITGFDYQGNLYLVRSAFAMQNIEKMIRNIRRNMTILSLLAISLALCLGWLFYYWLSQPLNRLSEAATKIATGAGDTIIPKVRGDSLKQLAQTVYEMSGQIQDKVTKLSHEKMIRDSIFNTLEEGVILIDRNGNILEINRMAAKLLDSGHQLAMGKSLISVWRNPEVEIFFNALLQGNEREPEIKKREMSFISDTKDICLTVESLYLENKGTFLLVLYDRTRVRKLENYRRDFIANLSHEIKTPLTVISGTTEALLDGAIEIPEKREQFLQTLSTHAQRLSRLLEDVISLANLECSPENHSLHFQRLPLAQTVQIAVALCKPRAQNRKMTLVFRDHTDDEVTVIVPELIEQAVINLVDNAIKYSIEGDTINIDLTVNQGENLIQIVVADHGRGIPKEHRERIFERFYRIDPSRDRQTGGTGLGLAIVKHIAQLHRGTVRVEPNNNESKSGAIFVISLPLGVVTE